MTRKLMSNTQFFSTSNQTATTLKEYFHQQLCNVLKVEVKMHAALFAIVPAVPVAHPQLARESVIPAPGNYRIRYGVNGRQKPGQAAAAAFDADPRIHIVAFSTSSSQGLLSAWLGWMAAMAAADPRHGYEIHAVTEPMLDTPGSGSFQDDLWFRANIRKIHVLLQVARGLPTGTAVIQTDLDVVPIRPYSLLPLPSVGMSFAVENSGGLTPVG